jgi:predicted RNA binding protein YcfA (HicA-like mRNA interferase family)
LIRSVQSTREVNGVQALKYRDLIKLLEDNGWYFERMGKGDHMIYRHATRARPVVIAGGGKLNRDVPPGTANAILRQAGLK